MSRLEEALKRSGTGELFGGEPAPSPELSAGGESAAPPAPTEADAVPVRSAAEISPAALRRPASIESSTLVGDVPMAPAEASSTLTNEPGPVATASGVAEKVVVDADTNPASVEQYRRLAAVLHHAQNERGLRVIMVTSALPGEGKTLTAANLALTLSESYQRRVLLVDGDLRRPSVHQLFALPSLSGLSDGLRSVEDRKLTLVEVSSHLTVLPAGRPDPDPMSVLTSSRMQYVLDEAREKFDWVIVDTPPVGLMPDAHLLAAMVDGALLVIGAAMSPHRVVAKAAEVIGRDRILGVVLNRVSSTDMSHGAYYYSYYGSSTDFSR
jgi:capsular exopolysaccharide synthesis family protein